MWIVIPAKSVAALYAWVVHAKNLHAFGVVHSVTLMTYGGSQFSPCSCCECNGCPNGALLCQDSSGSLVPFCSSTLMESLCKKWGNPRYEAIALSPAVEPRPLRHVDLCADGGCHEIHVNKCTVLCHNGCQDSVTSYNNNPISSTTQLPNTGQEMLARSMPNFVEAMSRVSR